MRSIRSSWASRSSWRALAAALPLAAGACATEPAEEPVGVTEAYKSLTCGNGVFEPGELCVTNPGATVIPTTQQVVTVLSVDMDGDFINDVVAVTASRVLIRKGVAGGFVGATVALGLAGATFTDVAVGDFDADAKPDLAATDAASGRVAVWHNNGALTFGAWSLVNVGGVGANPVRVLSARLNGDARADLVVLTLGTSEAKVLLANGAPFGVPMAYMVGDAEDIALGDCNADARPDLLYANGFGPAAQLRARVDDPFGNFGVPIVSALPLVDPDVGPLDSFAIAAGRFDADADADVVVSASQSRLAPMRSNGACSFAPTFGFTPMPVTWAWTRARLRTVDWDGNGHLDVAAPHGDPLSPGDQVYSIVPGSGFGTFGPYQAEPHPAGTVIPKDLAFTDVDGDGRLDVLVAAATGVIYERRIP